MVRETLGHAEIQDDRIDVLLVDDRPENLLALETVLASPEYRLVKASSGDDALRFLLDHEPALILMDVQMPDLDGFETAAIIKRSARTRNIPIIFITALNQDDRYVTKGYQHGAIDYVYKPYDPAILRSKVSVFAELARKTKSLVAAERQLREAEKRDRERQMAQLENRILRREQLAQKKYLDLVSGITHGIVWAVDVDSLVATFVSPSSETILGYSEDDWLREKEFLINHISPSDRLKVMGAIESAKLSRLATKVEHRFVSSAGKEIWFQSEFKVATRAEGDGHEIRGISIDISQMKEAQEVLTQSKRRSDFIGVISLILGKSFDIRQHLKQVGEVVVSEFADYYSIHELNEDESFKLVTECKSPHAEAWTISPEAFAELGLQKDLIGTSSRLWTELSADKILVKDYRVKSAILLPLREEGKTKFIMTWLTAKNGVHFQREEQLLAEDLANRSSASLDNAFLTNKAESAVKVRDEFLSVASHELKTPLTPLKLQAQLLSRVLKTGTAGDLKVEKVDKILNTFDRQLDRLSSLIDELLDISKMTNGKLSLNFERFDLVELIHDVLGRFSGQLASANCDVDLISETEIWVEWDRFRIEQVIVNLITNAAKYGQGKPIHVETEVNDGIVTVSFRDHGIGIAKSDLNRIFDRFERAVSGNNFSGLGLGLFIVTQLLEAHQGKIKVESEVGKGSQFTFEIPANIPPLIPNVVYKILPECLDEVRRSSS
jgi:PAS domain S-box-containing protein